MSLVDFLLARIVEDEAVASNNIGTGPWEVRFDCPKGAHHHDWDTVWISDPDGATIATSGERYTAAPREAAHIANHDPTRVLAECDAKRRIVERHPQVQPARDHYCAEDGEESPCPTLRLLALPYADHPDYREEWRP